MKPATPTRTEVLAAQEAQTKVTVNGYCPRLRVNFLVNDALVTAVDEHGETHPDGILVRARQGWTGFEGRVIAIETPAKMQETA